MRSCLAVRISFVGGVSVEISDFLVDCTTHLPGRPTVVLLSLSLLVVLGTRVLSSG